MIGSAVTGYAASMLQSLLTDRRAERREEHQRRAERHERRAEFERDTLISLQSAMFDVARAAGRRASADAAAARQLGTPWGAALDDAEMGEIDRVAFKTAKLLAYRVRDEQLRALVDEMTGHATAVTLARSEAQSDAEMGAMAQALMRATDRLRECLLATFGEPGLDG